MITITRKLLSLLQTLRTRTCHSSVKNFSITTMPEPVVTLQQGKLKGAVKRLLDESPYYSFKGIPYARPPIGPLRFAAPQPPLPWSGTLDATDHGPVCLQFNTITSEFIKGDENCLFLNVYTKSLDTSSKIPVMVFLHGGGYLSGSGNTCDGIGPEFLLQHDIILVTLNYRLEMLGFLSLDTAEVPGNAGLKDQAMALRWVRDNIHNFGGDSDNITLFGESAGGVAVTLHMQSPMSRGLFHKAIAQSGVSLCDWAYSDGARERAFRAGKILGYNGNDTNELLQFLRAVPAKKFARLTLATRTEDEKHRGLAIHFAPVLEKKFEGTEAFLCEAPIDVLLEKKMCNIPLLLGYNSQEGLVIVDYNIKQKLPFCLKNPQYFVPWDIVKRLSDEKAKEFGERIMKFYFGDKDYKEVLPKVVDLLSDSLFSIGPKRFAYFYAGISETIYFYIFNCDTELNVAKRLLGSSLDLKGATHADELFYLFYSEVVKDDYESQEKLRNLVYKITKLWTNFAKTKNPTPDSTLGVEWPLYKNNSQQALLFDETLTVTDLTDERIRFWNKLYSDAGMPFMSQSCL